MEKTRIALLGTGFIAEIHMESYQRFVPEAQIVSVYSRDIKKAASFAAKHQIPFFSNNMQEVITSRDCDVVDVCLPNFLHHEATLLASSARKHVIIEKPLALNLQQAEEMILACRRAGVQLMYAEELCYAPKYERVRQMVKEGAIGDIYMLKQGEKHSGPHSDWFYNKDLAGGGVLMDMGCHAFGWFRWMLPGIKVKSVYATISTVMHKTRTQAEDNSVVIIEFEDGTIGIAENSWAKLGGMDDRSEVYGSGGVIYADLFMGNASIAFSKNGYGYALEKAETTVGWTFPIFEEAFNQGYPQELKHFITSVRENKPALTSGEDGKAVLEIIFAAYASAAKGRKIFLPFSSSAEKPIDLWIRSS